MITHRITLFYPHTLVKFKYGLVIMVSPNWQLTALLSVSAFYARAKRNILSNKIVVVELCVSESTYV